MLLKRIRDLCLAPCCRPLRGSASCGCCLPGVPRWDGHGPAVVSKNWVLADGNWSRALTVSRSMARRSNSPPPGPTPKTLRHSRHSFQGGAVRDVEFPRPERFMRSRARNRASRSSPATSRRSLRPPGIDGERWATPPSFAHRPPIILPGGDFLVKPLTGKARKVGPHRDHRQAIQ